LAIYSINSDRKISNFLIAGNFTIEKEKFMMKENSGNQPKFEKSKEILQKMLTK
jgi:hypothetical protein